MYGKYYYPPFTDEKTEVWSKKTVTSWRGLHSGCYHVQLQGYSVSPPHPPNCSSVHCSKFGRPPGGAQVEGHASRRKPERRKGAAEYLETRPAPPSRGPGLRTTRPSRQLQGEEEEVGPARGERERVSPRASPAHSARSAPAGTGAAAPAAGGDKREPQLCSSRSARRSSGCARSWAATSGQDRDSV